MKKLITFVTVILTLQGVFAMDNTLTTKELAIVDLSAATARGISRTYLALGESARD